MVTKTSTATDEQTAVGRVCDYAAGCTFYQKYPKGSDARGVWSMLRTHWRVVPGTEDHDEIHFAAEYSAAYARLAGFDEDAERLTSLITLLTPSYIARDPKRRTPRWLAARARDTERTARTIVNFPKFKRELEASARKIAAKQQMSWAVLIDLGILVLPEP